MHLHEIYMQKWSERWPHPNDRPPPFSKWPLNYISKANKGCYTSFISIISELAYLFDGPLQREGELSPAKSALRLSANVAVA